MGFSTPVAFLIFKRPELTQKVFNVIAKVQPKQLLVVADGPPSEKEAEKCQQTRAIIQQVDWDCEVLTNFSDQNLGCKKRVSSGLNWVFSQVEEAIILEDDCLPDLSFFQFCETLLDYYRHDERIMQISGNNFQLGQSRTQYSYYFSKYPHIWGWATWRRAWQHYDVTMKHWPEFRQRGQMSAVFPNPEEQAYWTNVLERTYQGEINTWDFAWGYTCWLQNGLTVLPDVNLVTNIGFGVEATFTKLNHPLANLPTQAIHTLKHPPFVIVNDEADAYTSQYVFLNQANIYYQQSEIAKKRKEIEQASAQLRQLQEQIISTQQEITAMQSSKFWKLRQKWFKLKGKVGLNQGNDLPQWEGSVTQSIVLDVPETYETYEVETLSPIVNEIASELEIIMPESQPTTITPKNKHLQYIQAKVEPFTLVGPERIESLYNLSQRIDLENIPGDVIECGVCNGGTAAILAHFATNSYKYERKAWFFDSFAGMPETTEEDEEEAKEYVGQVVGDISQVLTVLNLVNANMTKVEILKGWFEETFPKVNIPKIALLNIDADWYIPVKFCLETFYDAVVPGGFISFDDYGHWPGCKKAVDEFFAERQLSYKLHEVDYTARWIQKL
ncbi:TylF/MycF/NovP-related O-methyltransferase [Crocosphaera chwakensis]|uniref:Methyltransferase FkbM n=1 Tax=Crocosphaera chwakensis CCY0110 TaxID=391612 RepID=A3IXG5_9CHRO|nr:TylF/MycF/NovP-related O-methyltransferase [Crocosphaera chwakensis]EAZ88812.1 Methyltransferase FkbM [Crocosphaera chwakensis CCY0110]